MFGVFKWIKDSARKAIVEGIQEGINEVSAIDVPMEVVPLQLPGLPIAEEEPESNGNGRRRVKVSK